MIIMLSLTLKTPIIFKYKENTKSDKQETIMAKGILLEAGTNEMELLVFRLDKVPFGINVAKVREIIQRTETIRIPHSPAAVEGSFKLRDRVLTLVNLGSFFRMEGDNTQSGEGMIIVVEFNNLICGILVDTVEVIYRLSWDQINPPSQYLMNIQAPVTGTAQVEGETVLIADFESIVGSILGLESAIIEDQDIQEDSVTKKDLRVLVVDDSTILRKSLTKILNKHGYHNLVVCSDGQEAWETINERKDQPNGAFDVIVSDIEMPRMDGMHLTSKIKQDPDLKQIPVILFSSLINKENAKKCEAVGADAWINKPDGEVMVQKIEELLEGKINIVENEQTNQEEKTVEAK